VAPNQDTSPDAAGAENAEERRQRFEAMLREAESEADRDGTFTVDDVLREMDRIIDAYSR
jgi:hypothetical protein